MEKSPPRVSVEPADQQRALVSVTPDLGGSAAQQAGAMALAPPVKLAGPAYATALEQAMAEQQREIALSRNEIEAARQEALQARRSEEHTKTELINARAKFAMDVAEIREGAARELDDRCERRAADARKRAAAADAAAAASRCALEAHRAQARRDVDAARKEAARADRASNRLLLILVLAAVGIAALTHRAVVMLPRKLDRRTSRAVRLRAALSEAVASNERAANACVQKIAEAHRDGARTKRDRLEACDAAAAETSRALADVAASHYFCAPVSAVARVVDVAAGARAACAAPRLDNAELAAPAKIRL